MHYKNKNVGKVKISKGREEERRREGKGKGKRKKKELGRLLGWCYILNHTGRNIWPFGTFPGFDICVSSYEREGGRH